MTDYRSAIKASQENSAWSVSGYFMLVLFVLLLAWIVLGVAGVVGREPPGSEKMMFLLGTFTRVAALVLISKGFYMIQPNQAAAITLFGSYRGH